MKWLALAGFVWLCGCQSSTKPLNLVAPKPPKSFDERLFGTWITKGDREARVTYTKEHSYSRRTGFVGFPTGYYQEDGRWEIYNGNYVELTPEHRDNHVLASDKKLSAEIRASMKIMDEGAWKPMPTPIHFIDDDSFMEDGPGSNKRVYRRVR